MLYYILMLTEINGWFQIKNKISLRNLSMVVRQETAISREERVANVEQGLELAKQAVEMDTNDGDSWSVLGNAHLSYFFTIQQNPKALKQAMSAYVQAVSSNCSHFVVSKTFIK